MVQPIPIKIIFTDYVADSFSVCHRDYLEAASRSARESSAYETDVVLLHYTATTNYKANIPLW